MGRLENGRAGRPGGHVECCRNASKKAVASHEMKGSEQVQENPRRWNWQDLLYVGPGAEREPGIIAVKAGAQISDLKISYGAQEK